MTKAIRRINAVLILGLLASPTIPSVAWGQQPSSSSTFTLNLDEFQEPWNLSVFQGDHELRDLAIQAIEDLRTSLATTQTARIGGEGGELRRVDKAAVIIPPAALSYDVDITLVTREDGTDGMQTQRRRLAMKALSLAAASKPLEFGPEGLRFQIPIMITLPYNPNLLSAKAIATSSLKVHYWNPETGEWEALESTINADEQTVSAQTDHFSLYQVLGPGDEGAVSVAATDDSFGLQEIYVYPNPARKGAKPVFHIEVGLADKATIRIYNIAGQQVHEVSIDTPPTLSGGKYAYEYTWNGRIPSGVYLYVIRAEKSGQAPIQKAGKFAIVR